MRKQIGLAAILSAAALLGSASVQAQDLGKARYLAANCANCHGTDGRSVGGIASLAGYERARFIQVMTEYREGKRPATIMHQISKGYSDDQVAQMAAFFAAQKK